MPSVAPLASLTVSVSVYEFAVGNECTTTGVAETVEVPSPHDHVYCVTPTSSVDVLASNVLGAGDPPPSGLSADERRQARQRRTKPLLDDLRLWLEAQLAAVSGKATIAGAIRYTLSRWDGLTRFLDDGRIEIDSNVVERAIRPIALGRKNHLFAGSDGGGEHWAVIASLIETCKMNGVNPQAYLRDVLARIVARHPMGRIDELLPFAYVSAADKAAA